VLSVGVLAGVVVGVALSLGWLVYVATSPPMPLQDETFPGVAVLRLDGGLFFATAEALEERVRELVGTHPRSLVIDLAGVSFMDSQGADSLTAIQQLVESSGGALRLAHAKPQVLAVLQADGFVDRLGADHIHPNVAHALDAQSNE
jgi:anti-anti-sigma factor